MNRSPPLGRSSAPGVSDLETCLGDTVKAALLSIFIGVAALFLAFGPSPAPGAIIWVLRIALAGTIGWACVTLAREGCPIALTGPLPLLAILSGLGFSVVPAAYTAFELALDGTVRYDRSVLFLGGQAELFIIHFSATTLAVAIWVAPLLERRIGATEPPQDVWPGTPMLIAAVALVAAVLYLVTRRSAAFSGLAASRLWRDLVSSTPPILSLLVSLATVLLARRLAPARVAFLVLTLALMAATLYLGAHHNKMTAYAAVIAVSYIALSHARRSQQFLVVGAFGALAALLVALTTIGDWQQVDDRLSVVLGALAYKFVFRQTDTGACLASVINEHFDDPPSSGLLSLFTGIIPAYFWQEKPSLSVGSIYAVRYCGYPDEIISTLNAGHSASVTLIGDTLIYGGLAGYAFGLLVLLAILAAFTIYSARRGTTGSVVLLAITPWLIDFDQHYPLYLAVALKNLLYMMPFLILIRLSEKVRHP